MPDQQPSMASSVMSVLMSWHFKHRSGCPEADSQAKYAQFLEGLSGHRYKQSWWVKSQRPSAPARPLKHIDLPSMALKLANSSNPREEIAAHCLWELCQAFGQELPDSARYSAALDAKRCRLQARFGLSSNGVPAVDPMQPTGDPVMAAGAVAEDLPGLDELVDQAARLLLAADSVLKTRLVQIAADELQLRTSLEGRVAVSAVDAFLRDWTQHSQAPGQAASPAISAVLRLLDELTWPADPAAQRRGIAAMNALFQLCLIRFAVVGLPKTLKTGRGRDKSVAWVGERNLVSIALVHEAWQGGLLQFSRVSGAAADGQADQAVPSHYIVLSTVNPPGQAARQHLMDIATTLDLARDANMGGQRGDRLGMQPATGRVRAVLESERDDEQRHWRAVLRAQPADLKAQLQLAHSLHAQLGLPCVVAQSELGPRDQAARANLRNDSDYLEQRVLTYLTKLDNSLRRTRTP